MGGHAENHGRFHDIVLTPSDWTIDSIMGLLSHDLLDLDSGFQRRDAWNASRKSAFIESLILGVPVPNLVFAELDGRGPKPRYAVVDGKRRILALKACYADREPLRLQGLMELPQLNGRTVRELSADSATSWCARALAVLPVRVVTIRGRPDDEFLRLVFFRMNQETVPLSTQEVRHASHQGPFARFVSGFAAKSRQLHGALRSSMPHPKMHDVDLLTRFLAYRLRLAQHRGDLKKFLDETYDQFNRNWEAHREAIHRETNRCNTAIDVTRHIFGVHAFSLHTRHNTWENRFNRAVFDVMLYYFADEAVAELAVARADGVVHAYEHLSRSDPEFRQALMLTTKKVDATVYRLKAWGEALDRAIGGGVLNIPRLSKDGRITVGGP